METVLSKTDETSVIACHLTDEAFRKGNQQSL
jgi:hypothetical protein